MSWNLPRIINNLEAEISTGYVKDPATRDFSLAGYDIKNANLVKCNDVETNTVFSVNDELDKLDNFEASTPDVTTIVGKLKVDNIDTNIIYSADELTRIELDDSDINLISQNLTWNGVDVATIANLETLENKTFYISPDLSVDGTIFSNGIYADRYIVNGDQTIPKFLMSDGSLNDSGGFVVLNDSEIPINANTKTTYLDIDYNLYTGTDNGFPRQAPNPTYYIGATISVSNEAELDSALINSINYGIINITANITLTSVKTISKKLKITASVPNIKITYASAFNIFNITVSEVWFNNLSFNNNNAGSNTCILGFSGSSNDNIFVTNCIFETNEFAISSNVKNIQITNNTFKFVGTADSHRYIILSGLLGNCYINDNIFEGNTTASSTQCININNGLSTAFLNGNLIMKNNISQTLPVQRLLMVDISLVNSNLSIYASNNTMTCTSGFMIFYTSPLSGVKQIYLYKNTEILGATATGSKGLIGLDSPAFSNISFNTKIYSSDNTIPVLRADYTDLTNPLANQPKTIAYATARFTPTQTYDLIVPKIGTLMTSPLTADLDMAENNIINVATVNGVSINDIADKTYHIQLPLSGVGTVFSENVYADSFIKTNGTNQQYLMADGSSLQYSANSGNSNFYLYTSSQTISSTPTSGHITYNNANQSLASVIYISHLTKDNIDIEVFFRNLSSLNDVYIQDQSTSESYIKYNINGTPSITVDSKVEIPVAIIEALGDGASSFGPNHPVLLSFFTNSIETDMRLSTLETKTQNIQAISSKLTVIRSTELLIDEADFFAIRSIDGLINYLVFNPTVTMLYNNLNLNGNSLFNVSAIKISGFESSNYFIKTDGTIDENDYLASITDLQDKTQHQSAIASETQFAMNTACIIRNGETDAFEVRSNTNTIRLKVDNNNVTINNPLLMSGLRIKNVGSPTQVGDAAVVNALFPNSVPYFTSTNRLSGSAQNLYVQQTDLNFSIQDAIDALTVGGAVGGCIQVSSGGSTQNIICSRQNYTLVGAICPPFTQTTQITGNLTIGSAAFLSTRVRVSHMKFDGNLIFDNSTNQQLRTYFYNCDFSGTVTFPTSAATGTNGTQIFFENCSFTSAMTIPNQNLYTIFFTRCAFVGQTITNQQPVGNTTKTIFSDCSYLPTLSSLGFCVLNGPNTTLSTTQANYGSIVLGGSATSLLKGNGTTLSGTVNQFVMGNGTLTTSNANSVMKGDGSTLAGTASQYVMGNGTLTTPSFTTITSLTGNATYNGVNIGYTARRVGIVGAGICTVFIGGFSATASSTTSTLISNSFLPATYRPANAVFLPCRITKFGTISLGTLIIYASGEIGITNVAQSTDYWTAGNTGCGIAGDFTVSFPTV